MSEFEKSLDLKPTDYELKSRIAELKKAEAAVDSYADNHRCSWLDAISALGVLDPDEPENYGLLRNDDGTYGYPYDVTQESFNGLHPESDKNIDEDDRLEYINRNGDNLSFNQINRDADSQGLPLWNYMKMHGIVPVNVLPQPEEVKKEFNGLDSFLDNITSNESHLFIDIINISILLDGPEAILYEGSFEKKSLELIHMRMRREKIKLTTDQERGIIQSFKDILIGSPETRLDYIDKINKIDF